MADENKSSLQKVIEELLARAKANQSPMAQVNAQMSAKDPNFAAGALVGQLLSNYIGNYLQRGRERQTIQDTNSPTTVGEEPAAVQNINQFGSQQGLQPNIPLQLGLLGNEDDWENKYVPYPFYRG